MNTIFWRELMWEAAKQPAATRSGPAAGEAREGNNNDIVINISHVEGVASGQGHSGWRW